MKKFLIIAFAALLSSSCSKKMEKFISLPQQVNGTDSRAINKSLDDAALIVATSLKQEALRSFIKAEALKQFDGDYDILYKSARTATINGRSLESIFSGNIHGRFPQAKVFEDIISNIQNFQISVPVHGQEWDAVKYTPLVAIAQTGIDEKELRQIKAYDSDGNIHLIDAQTEPGMPVIVVGISERVDEKGALKYTFEGAGTAAMRTNGQNTILGSIQCPTLSHIESWANGKPELRLRVLGAKLLSGSNTPTNLTVTTKFYTCDRSTIDGKWYNPNTSLYNWYIDWSAPTGSFVYSNEMKFYWIEEDSGPTGQVSLNVGLGGSAKSSGGIPINVSGSIKINFQSIDEDLGDALVYYTDGTTSHNYSVGSELKFELD